MKPNGSSLCSYERAAGPYTVLHEFSQHSHILLRPTLISSFHLHLGLPRGPSLQVSQIK